jgi:hypothetical protein
MPIIDLPQGRVQYRLAGPNTSDAPPVVSVYWSTASCGRGSPTSWPRAGCAHPCPADTTKHSSTARNGPARSFRSFSTVG